MNISFEDWHCIDYGTALERQHSIFTDTINKKLSGIDTTDIIVMCEHPHVITLGQHGNANNLLLDIHSLRERGIDFYNTDRGGDITYHGPGQLVVYPIIDIQHFGLGLKSYISRLEEAVIDLLATYNIIGSHVDGASGVWVDAGTCRERKICAVGVRSSRYITMHGIGLNVNTDLRYFKYINPCGFVEKGVTSIRAEIGHEIDMDEVKAKLKEFLICRLREVCTM